jgi:hypothetical protein
VKVPIKLATGLPVVQYGEDASGMGRGTGSLWQLCHVSIEGFNDGGRQVVARMFIDPEILRDWPPEKIIQRFIEGFNAK